MAAQNFLQKILGKFKSVNDKADVAREALEVAAQEELFEPRYLNVFFAIWVRINEKFVIYITHRWESALDDHEEPNSLCVRLLLFREAVGGKPRKLYFDSDAAERVGPVDECGVEEAKDPRIALQGGFCYKVPKIDIRTV